MIILKFCTCIVELYIFRWLAILRSNWKKGIAMILIPSSPLRSAILLVERRWLWGQTTHPSSSWANLNKREIGEPLCSSPLLHNMYSWHSRHDITHFLPAIDPLCYLDRWAFIGHGTILIKFPSTNEHNSHSYDCLQNLVPSYRTLGSGKLVVSSQSISK